MENKINLKTAIVFLIILMVTFSRLLPHIVNFSPLTAISLFGVAHFQKKWQAFLLPIFSVWLSDLALNNILYANYFEGFTWFYPGFYWQYGSLLLIVVLGMFSLEKVNIKSIIGSVITASLIFFLISNFGVWLGSKFYPQNLTGLITCYIAGLPFLKGTILGDLFYSGLMFGLFATLQSKFSVLKVSKS
jgi:hypothetical protein